MSSGLALGEHFLEAAGFDRAPWLAVGFGAGVACWFLLSGVWQWWAFLALCAGFCLAALAGMRAEGRFPRLRLAIAALSLAMAAGMGIVWAKAELMGTPALPYSMVAWVEGRVLAREDQPAKQRVRLLVAIRNPDSGRPARVRINLEPGQLGAPVLEGARVRLRARLVPPAAPLLPGGYDFARAAWFAGIAATGRGLGPVEVTAPAPASADWLAGLRRALSEHVRGRLAGSAGGIAAAFASGDRGGIAPADEDALRDAGLSHLLSVSGLHVSAVIGAAYFLAMRLLALWPWLALRVRLPLVAAGFGALAGIFYTVLTGAEVPTVRSCIGALLVLAALALGRQPLSLRLLATAAFVVMLFWPEAVMGPSFQLSFGAVLAIIALHNTAWVRAFMAPREENWPVRLAREGAMLLVTGFVIELALAPIGLFHFRRTGLYGAFANVIAIPLTTFITMPLLALALLFDCLGLGAPFWWAVGRSLDLLLWLAHHVAGLPGAVTLFPAMGTAHFALFLGGGLWLGVWRGYARLWGLLPVAVGVVGLAFLHSPDLMVSGDGRQVGIAEQGRLLVLRQSRNPAQISFAQSNFLEAAGLSGQPIALTQWPGARCNRDFCLIHLSRGGRDWALLMTRSRALVPLDQLAATCAQVDIVIADRRLPHSCQPRSLKIDRAMLVRTGGLTLDLASGGIAAVAQGDGRHGWEVRRGR